MFEPEIAREATLGTTAATAASKKATENEATAIYKKAQQAAVELTLKLVGDPEISAKTVIEVSGISKRLSGKYYVKSAVHEIASGYTTTLKLTSDGVNAALGDPNAPKGKSKAKQNTLSCAEVCRALDPVPQQGNGEIQPPDGGWPEDILTGQTVWSYQEAGSGTALRTQNDAKEKD
jgi:hypothetical protein